VLNRRSRHPQEEAAQQQLPPPPLMTIEQMFLMQTQAVQAIGQTLAAVQQVQQQQSPPQHHVQVQMPQVPRDMQEEFMRGHPPVFAHSTDPMDAKDWLHTVEREFHTTQCNDREKVLYGPRKLREQHSLGGSLTSPPMPTLKPSPERSSGTTSVVTMCLKD
jgi:hypothetical protein